MAKRVITITKPDGTKRVVVAEDKEHTPVKTIESEPDRRPKPGTPKISISDEKNGYKYGGKLKRKTC